MAPRQRVLRNKEDIEKVPSDQPVLIEVSSEEEVTQTKPETPETPEKEGKKDKPEVRARESETPTPEPEQPDLNALQKRIAELEQAERAERERAARLERQNREEAQRNQELQEEISKGREAAQTTRLSTLTAQIAAAQAESDAAQQAFEQAALAGDYKAQAVAQTKMARAQARLDRLDADKASFEERSAAEETTTTGRVLPSGDPIERTLAQMQVPDKAKDWLRSHTEFITDQRKNAKITAAHWDVVEAGHAAYSPSYFEDLEVRLGLRQRQDDTTDHEADEPTPRRNQQVSAPVTRDAPSPSTGKPVTTRITLSPEQREAARAAGVDELTYARNLIKLNELKKNGHYTER